MPGVYATLLPLTTSNDAGGMPQYSPLTTSDNGGGMPQYSPLIDFFLQGGGAEVPVKSERSEL